MATATDDFDKALAVGRPPTISKLFPNSRALLVSGKYIDLAMELKGKAMTIAANGRNNFIIRGVLAAAQRANAAIIIEIARSEGGATAYCPTNYWNMARQVDQAMNELGITIPVAIHADHYGIKSEDDLPFAKQEIPTLFEHGITSIAIDASHMLDDKNLFANLEVNPLIPDWAGLETEIGEIKGTMGMSAPPEAVFLIAGLNAHNIFPNWIALNNGTTHGLESSGQGIQVDLTTEVHKALAPYKVSGAQHGTSGNNSDRLRDIAAKTNTTKANVATALQMLCWGLAVNEYGNAILDDNGNFQKIAGEGVTEEMWQEMVDYADQQGWDMGGYKNLNLAFENKFHSQSTDIKARMCKRVEDFVYDLLVNVFNAENTSDYCIEAIIKRGSYDPGPKADKIESADDWTREKIIAKAAELDTDKGPEGDFDD
jgi:fructose/tagatose bisphosphate aldolase